jgi:hypothetical protein
MLSADGAVLVADGLFEKDLTLLGLFACTSQKRRELRESAVSA